MGPVVKMQPIQRQILVSLSPGSTPFISSTPPPQGITYNASIICSTNFTYHTNIDYNTDTVYSRKIDREFKLRARLEFCVVLIEMFQEEYRSEGISLERISFTDNRPVLDMFLQVICY